MPGVRVELGAVRGGDFRFMGLWVPSPLCHPLALPPSGDVMFVELFNFSVSPG